jgi:lysophospholipase L1-like esterase
MKTRRRAMGFLLSLPLALLLIEALAGLAEGLLAPPLGSDPRASAQAFASAPWAAACLRELAASQPTRWEPYSYWRRRAFVGEHIQIAASGERRTLHPSEPAPGTPEIWCFGGSTLWGAGARDQGTIPSHLAALLPGYRLRNFGESGYVSLQSRLQFLRQLESEPAPRAVLFYEGVNDLLSAFQQARTGLPLQEGFRALEFNSRLGALGRRWFDEASGEWRPRDAPARWRLALAESATAGWLRRAGLLSPLEARLAPAAALELGRSPASDPAELVRGLVELRARQLAWTRALVASQGAVLMSAFQPNLYEKSLSGDEAGFAAAYPGQAEFFRAVAAAQRADARLADQPDAPDLSRLFEQRGEPLFFDFCHVNETGNRLIAEALAAALAPLLQDSP